MNRTTSNRSRALKAACKLTLLAALASTGCVSHTPGGPQMSADRYTIESTVHMPQTVTIIDLRTGEEVWTSEVPVGKKLTFQFYPERSTNSYMPDLLRWEMIDLSVARRGLRNAMRVPPAHARRVDIIIRESPEFETEFSSNATP